VQQKNSCRRRHGGEDLAIMFRDKLYPLTQHKPILSEGSWGRRRPRGLHFKEPKPTPETQRHGEVQNNRKTEISK
jgi:hypothetical protein